MNEGQLRFYNFVMERVQEDKKEDMEAILSDNFKRQQEGTFTKDYMAEIVPQMMSLLRAECIEEFKQAAQHISAQLG